VSGDGDSASIGLGQFANAMRRGVRMAYIVENNGVYGLTKGQFSATADAGSVLKGGAVNQLPAIDTCALAIQLGAAFVARSFSGDKKQLSALLRGAISHGGTALLDVLSPCVTFNDHEGSTKSFAFVKEHDAPLQELSYVPAAEEITVDYQAGSAVEVTMHDGSRLRLKKLEAGYDPRDRVVAVTRLLQAQAAGEVLTGLLYVDPAVPTLMDRLGLPPEPLATLPPERVRPARSVLDAINASLR
jgi:2-oxoglutarate ferredoxin oxidoreductase subunit beta